MTCRIAQWCGSNIGVCLSAVAPTATRSSRRAIRGFVIRGVKYRGFWLTRGKFYKRRSQEKTHPLRLEFFLLRSPLDGAGFVLTVRTMCSVAGRVGPAVGVFSTSGFHRFFATKPVSSETSKAERWSNLATIVLLGTRWPIAFSGYPRGPRV